MQQFFSQSTDEYFWNKLWDDIEMSIKKIEVEIPKNRNQFRFSVK